MTLVTALTKLLRADPKVSEVAVVDKHQSSSTMHGQTKARIIVETDGSWFTDRSTAQYPRISLVSLADATRENGTRIDNAEDLALNALNVVASRLNRVGGQMEQIADSAWWILTSDVESGPVRVSRPYAEQAAYRLVMQLKVMEGASA